MVEDVLYQQLIVLLFEVNVAFFAALFSVYFVGFFGPIQSYREALVVLLMMSIPERFNRILAPLYCAKCAAFWSAGLFMVAGSGFGIHSLRVACLAGAFGYILDQRLNGG